MYATGCQCIISFFIILYHQPHLCLIHIEKWSKLCLRGKSPVLHRCWHPKTGGSVSCGIPCRRGFGAHQRAKILVSSLEKETGSVSIGAWSGHTRCSSLVFPGWHNDRSLVSCNAACSSLWVRGHDGPHAARHDSGSPGTSPCSQAIRSYSHCAGTGLGWASPSDVIWALADSKG